jgi:DNA-binding MarR family transcriptional regulator
MEKQLIEYLNILRNFGRIYRDRILDGNSKLKKDLKLSLIRALYAFKDKDRLSMKELAANIGVKLPNMTMMIDNLEEEGIVERARDDLDRRKVIVRLTPRGKRIKANFLAQRHRIAQTILANLQHQDKKELLYSLSNTCRILKKAFNKDLL